MEVTAMSTTIEKERQNISTASTGATAGAGSKTNGVPGTTVVTHIKKRKRRKRTVLILLGVALLAVIGLAVVNSGKQKAIIVQTEKVGRRTITEVVQATGKIQPEVKVKVSPEVSGEIIQLPYKEGAQVANGAVVARIKPTSFEAQYEQGVASVNASKARLEQARASMLTAKSEFKRAEDLKKKNLLSDQEFESAQSRYQVAEATFNASKYEVSAAESQLKQLSESLRKTTVYAPMAGVITSLISQLGEKVVGTSQFSGTEMMTISDLSIMNAEVEVDENDVVNISIGDKAEVTIDAFPNRIFHGNVVEIANSAKVVGTGTQDQSTNFAVKVRLTDFEGADLRPGMSCTAKIQTETKENVLAVPMMAVATREVPGFKPDTTKVGGDKPTVVFVVDKSGEAKLVQVKVGISDNSYIEVLSGLQGTEEIIKGNFNAVNRELEDKSKIQIDNKVKKPEDSKKS